jgi:FMN phosphatase YigB (HAD superfamily)
MTDATAAPERALTLDLWHTLVYLDPAAEETYMREQIALATGLLEAAPTTDGAARSTPPELRRAFEAVYAEAVAASQRGVSVPPARQIEEAGRRTGRAPDPREYVAGLAGLVGRTEFRPAAGALEVLRELADDGWALGIISNTVGEPGASLRPVLHRFGFDRVVRSTTFSDEHPWTKPAPELFRQSLRALGVPPERAVHIGYGWVDIEGARRAGYRAGILFTGLQEYGAKYRELFLPPDWSAPLTPYRVRRWDEVPKMVGSFR